MNHRRFEFTDEKSHKFWSICLEGDQHTVQYGRIGTDGQTQTKEFASGAEAKRSCERLVEVKLRKGYIEVVDGTSASPPPSTSSPRNPFATAAAPAASLVKAPKPPEPSTRGEPTAPLAPSVVTGEISRAIRLDPEGWFWATWRPLTPLPRPSAGAFVREEALSRLSRHQRHVRLALAVEQGRRHSVTHAGAGSFLVRRNDRCACQHDGQAACHPHGEGALLR
jgi:predicted DNA-binding WGR domain protein